MDHFVEYVENMLSQKVLGSMLASHIVAQPKVYQPFINFVVSECYKLPDMMWMHGNVVNRVQMGACFEFNEANKAESHNSVQKYFAHIRECFDTIYLNIIDYRATRMLVESFGSESQCAIFQIHCDVLRPDPESNLVRVETNLGVGFSNFANVQQPIFVNNTVYVTNLPQIHAVRM